MPPPGYTASICAIQRYHSNDFLGHWRLGRHAQIGEHAKNSYFEASEIFTLQPGRRPCMRAEARNHPDTGRTPGCQASADSDRTYRAAHRGCERPVHGTRYHRYLQQGGGSVYFLGERVTLKLRWHTRIVHSDRHELPPPFTDSNCSHLFEQMELPQTRPINLAAHTA